MKRTKRIFCVAIACIAALSLSACGQNSASPPASSDGSAAVANAPDTGFDFEPFTITCATSNGDSDVKTQCMYKFKEDLEAASNGLITVETYPAGQLLKDVDMPDGIPNNTADIGLCGLGWWSGLVPEVTALGLIGVLKNENAYWECCEAEDGLFNYLGGEFEKKANTKVLTFLFNGASECLLMNGHSIKTPEDFIGVKFEAPNLAMASAADACGATSVVLSVTELYTSLQNGVIDGIWNGLINADSNNFWSVVDYVSNLKVAYSDAFGMVVSLDVWNSWPVEAQELIQKEAQIIYEYSHSYVADHNQAIWDKLESDPGIEVYYIPEDDAAKFGALMAPVQLENMKKNVGDASYEEIMRIIDKYNT